MILSEGLTHKVGGLIKKAKNRAASSYKQSYDLDDLLEDKYFYLIYKLAANHSGTSVQEVRGLLGPQGIEKLDDLLRIGAVYIENEFVLAKHSKFSLSIKTAKRNVSHLLSLFKEDDISKGQNLLYSLSESLSAEGIEEMKNAQKDAIYRMREIIENPKYLGRYPYFFITVMDIISLNDLEV